VQDNFRLAVLSLLLLPLLGCAAIRPEMPWFRPSPGALFSEVGVHPLSAIPELVSSADFILIGEGHTNPCDHRMQELILHSLAGTGQRFVLGLEMVDVTRQEVLDRFNLGELSPAGLEEALDWPRSWGHNFSLYEGLFETAARWSIPVHGLNLPSSVVRTIGREGLEGVELEERRFIPERIVPPAPEQVEKLRTQYGLHRTMLGEGEDVPGLERFLLAQSLWDTFMAERAVELFRRQGAPLVIIAGGGHVEHGWGIARRIRAFQPGASILTIQPWRGGERPHPEEADLFFHCPERHRSRLGFELQEERGAVLVTSVQPGSRADAAGIEKGDRILRASGMPVRTMFDLHKGGVAAGKAGVPLVLEVLRNGETLEIGIGREE
jgi:uncharacterized iron-regulated protein